MSTPQIELTGTLRADGTVKLDQQPTMTPGRVRLVIEPVVEPAPPKEDWWQLMQRLRARREATGYPFMNDKELNAHIELLRD